LLHFSVLFSVPFAGRRHRPIAVEWYRSLLLVLMTD